MLCTLRIAGIVVRRLRQPVHAVDREGVWLEMRADEVRIWISSPT